MNTKEKIINLYYEEKMTNKSISDKLNVSLPYITKIIKTDNRYQNEKLRRKNESAIKQKRRNIECIKRRREVLRDERINGSMKLQHMQDVIELSGRHTINNREFKKWNTSIYQYYDRTKEFRVKQELESKTSYAVPKRIKLY